VEKRGMNELEQEANRRIAVFEQQKAECRIACLRFFDALSIPQIDAVLSELNGIKDECEMNSGGRAVVMQLGLLEIDNLLAEWMATKGAV
jgi:hypothetical protein